MGLDGKEVKPAVCASGALGTNSQTLHMLTAIAQHMQIPRKHCSQNTTLWRWHNSVNKDRGRFSSEHLVLECGYTEAMRMTEHARMPDVHRAASVFEMLSAALHQWAPAHFRPQVTSMLREMLRAVYQNMEELEQLSSPLKVDVLLGLGQPYFLEVHRLRDTVMKLEKEIVRQENIIRTRTGHSRSRAVLEMGIMHSRRSFLKIFLVSWRALTTARRVNRRRWTRAKLRIWFNGLRIKVLGQRFRRRLQKSQVLISELTSTASAATLSSIRERLKEHQAHIEQAGLVIRRDSSITAYMPRRYSQAGTRRSLGGVRTGPSDEPEPQPSIPAGPQEAHAVARDVAGEGRDPEPHKHTPPPEGPLGAPGRDFNTRMGHPVLVAGANLQPIENAPPDLKHLKGGRPHVEVYSPKPLLTDVSDTNDADDSTENNESVDDGQSTASATQTPAPAERALPFVPPAWTAFIQANSRSTPRAAARRHMRAPPLQAVRETIMHVYTAKARADAASPAGKVMYSSAVSMTDFTVSFFMSTHGKAAPKRLEAFSAGMAHYAETDLWVKLFARFCGPDEHGVVTEALWFMLCGLQALQAHQLPRTQMSALPQAAAEAMLMPLVFKRVLVTLDSLCRNYDADVAKVIRTIDAARVKAGGGSHAVDGQVVLCALMQLWQEDLESLVSALSKLLPSPQRDATLPSMVNLDAFKAQLLEAGLLKEPCYEKEVAKLYTEAMKRSRGGPLTHFAIAFAIKQGLHITRCAIEAQLRKQRLTSWQASLATGAYTHGSSGG